VIVLSMRVSSAAVICNLRVVCYAARPISATI
jgi:hypothetical protein